ncbi:MAG: nuclear transport factor 2 family protein [Bacteroidetes bacterium]|nr:nuclear transport factor 2 family protein [Bacteroidota bacterium]MBS1932340.1 nuclear transport factor 2 family protein [Bacteroidota bacterium]
MNNAKKSALNRTYKQFMNAGFRSEGLSLLPKIVVNDVAGYGSAEDEKIQGIAGLKVLLRNQKKQAKGMKFTWKTKPFSRYITEDENTAVYADEVYLSIKAGKELIKMYLRFSVVLNYINNQWKVIHWHGSKPEQVLSEEDTFGIDSLKQKNAELENLVKEKTADLTQKNRELEIEASLERVRSRTMAMHKTSELQEVIHVVHQELLHLDLSNDGGSFVVINKDVDADLRCWGSGGTANTSEEILVPHFNMPFCKNLINGIKKGRKFFTEAFSQKEKKEFFTKLFKQKPWSAISSKQKKETLSAPGGYTRSVAVSKHTSIFIINHQGKTFTEAENDILKRFAKVFEQAYTRFLDLQNSEAQAREAQIEAALERVRSSSLAMHRSKELQNVVNIVIERLKKLDIELDTSNILIFNRGDKTIEFWTGTNSTGEQLKTSWKVPFTDFLYYKDIQNAHQKGNEIFKGFYSFEEKNKMFRYLFTKTDFKNLNEERKNFILTSKRATIVTGLVKDIGIQVISYSRESFFPEEINIVKRFSQVFNQAYTRFLDLQRAEALAREAQIEVALERVRTRTMAMQKSNELPATAELLFQQLKNLGEEMMQTTIGILNEPERLIEFSVTDWGGSGTSVNRSFKLSVDEPTLISKMYKAWKEQNGAVVVDLTGKELEDWLSYRNRMSGIAVYSGDTAGRRVVTIAPFSRGLISFSSPRPSPDESIQILERFAATFDLTYTRFLDLQKAEAQAREAQIEIGLERVRSRAMAMQSSEELNPLIGTVFTELTKLDLALTRCIIWIFEPTTNAAKWWMANSEEPSSPMSFFIKYHEHPAYLRFVKEWKNQNVKFVYDLKGKDKIKWDEILFNETELKNLPDVVKDGMRAPERVLLSASFNNFGGLNVATLEPLSDEHFDIMLRFAKVFDLTYTRFLDLKKAEAQAREAQIEIGLERVRSRAMAMQCSEELNALIGAVFTELTKLDVELTRCAIMIFENRNNEKGSWQWMINAETPSEPMSLFMKYSELPYFKAIRKGWNDRILKWQYVLEGKDKFVSDEFLFKETDLGKLPGFVIEAMREPDKVYISASFNNFGCIILASIEPLSNEHFDILLRFSKVFDLTYTRFNDLKQAEAQAREAQIEAGLERVRSRSMAMHKSEELKQVIRVVLDQFVHLKINVGHAGFYIDYKAHDDMHIWLADPNIEPFFAILPYFDTPTWNSFLEAKAKGTTLHTDLLDFKTKNKFYKSLFKLFEIPEKAKEFYLQCKGLAVSTVLLDSVGLYIENFDGTPYTNEENNILLRFGKVFQQAYTRFLDLQKAEAQAREAQIQLALERVSAKTMAMQKQNELLGVLNLLVEQLVKLGVQLEVANFSNGIPGGDWDLWIEVVTNDGTIYNNYVHFSRIDHPYFNRVEKNIEIFRNEGKDLFKDVFSKEEKDAWQDYIYAQTIYKDITPQEHRQIMYEKTGYTWSMILLKDTWISICRFNTIPFSDEEDKLLRRFANAFSLAYTRFLDLQKAEAQAREAQVEAALERVRSRSLAMHKSDELAEVILVVSDQLQQLGFRFHNASFVRYNEKNGLNFWLASPGQPQPYLIQVPYLDNPVFNRPLEAIEKGIDFMTDVLTPEENQIWIKHLIANSALSNLTEEDKKDLLNTRGFARSLVITKNIILVIGNYASVPYSDDQNAILKKVGNVFEQAYTRFLDLQKAEAQAREAKIEAALEKVRSRTMAMQKSDELAETSAVLFRQLIQLGIEPNRLYISIIQNVKGDSEFWITDEDGSKVSSLYAANLNDNSSFKKMLDGWNEQKKSLILDMHGDELENYFKHLNSLNVPFKGGLSQKRRWQYIAYFSKGFIGMASPDEQPAETMQLLERFASVFNLTFTRFNDLQIAEAHALQAEQDLIEIKAARKKAEDTLAELQATQKQLVQSEKMASLGELTAGIAHEIQNPLNFVNNFSEVSKELLDEIKEAIEKGNTEDAKEIMNDVIQNLEKINHHGKRADGIVKGMLQHSRTSSGQKELTDINALCDEYLRLAYHGLRAKDKSFNAKFETEFDNNIPKMNIVPQDIGRVILNLINNAFYAVSEKAKSSKQNAEGYEPTVVVSTKNSGNKVEVNVKDNGNGIPDKIKDKIFQPFFTTKPTGQGTGLGLSLSYDIIIKGHGGEIKVNTKENEGTEFIIQLPVV